MNSISAGIIAIGDEILLGQIIDTNSVFIAKALSSIGVWPSCRMAIGDDKRQIVAALETVAADCDIIIFTGGLGPTKDDITKKTLADFFGSEIKTHLPTKQLITNRLAGKNIPNSVFQMAELPTACKIIENGVGLAPAMHFEWKGKHIFSLPGVPREMQFFITQHIIPFIQKSFALGKILHKTLLTATVGESRIAERLRSFEKQLPPHFALAYLPTYNAVKLRLTATQSFQESEFDRQFKQLSQLLVDITINDNNDSIEKTLGDLLIENKLTISTAESCTAGNIAHMISTIPGASQYLKGGIVSYVNEIKIDLLDVDKDTIEKYTEVSEETVIQMLAGTLKKFNSNIGIAVSGILGPSGATAKNPVGTVWIAVGNTTKTMTKKCHFTFDREGNMWATTNTALALAIQFLRHQK